jgi:anti-sigma factor RsiW
MMTCEELLAYLSQYIDQELDDELAQAAQHHLAVCQNCQVVLNTTKQTIILGQGQQQRAIPFERRAQLLLQLQEAFLKQPPSPHSS